MIWLETVCCNFQALSGLDYSISRQARFLGNTALDAALNAQFLVQIGIFTAVPMIMGFILELGLMKVSYLSFSFEREWLLFQDFAIMSKFSILCRLFLVLLQCSSSSVRCFSPFRLEQGHITLVEQSFMVVQRYKTVILIVIIATSWILLTFFLYAV